MIVVEDCKMQRVVSKLYSSFQGQFQADGSINRLGQYGRLEECRET